MQSRDIIFYDRTGSFAKLEDTIDLTKLLGSGLEYCPAYRVNVPNNAPFARYCPLIAEIVRMMDAEGKTPPLYMADRPMGFGCVSHREHTCPLEDKAITLALEFCEQG